MSASASQRRASIRRGNALLLGLALLLSAPPGGAWPKPMTRIIARDACRLLPGSLARFLATHDDQIADEWSRLSPSLELSLYADLVSGDLGDATHAALAGQVAEILGMFKERRVSEGLLRLGALARFPADLSDPILTVGAEGYPAGVAREYYAFIEVNLDKIPVTLVHDDYLEISVQDLGTYWRRLIRESRQQSVTLRVEMIRGGRILDHRYIDYRSPVFAVGSISYSRAVNAVATTWLAVWREAGGDMTRQSRPRTLAPGAAARQSSTRNPRMEATSR